MEAEIALVVLIGLPGAGKSTLCKKLVDSLYSKPNSSEICLIHVCFDELIPLELQEKFVLIKQSKLEDAGDGTSWKSARQDVYCKVERLIECIRNNTCDPNVLAHFSVHGKDVANVKYVVLLDDNFYYRSMRYEYFQLARKHTIGFCQCYIECEMEMAVQQNLGRDSQVPTAAIEVMAKNLQPPHPQDQSWEHNSVFLSSNTMDELDAVWNIIEKGLDAPVPPIENRDSEIAEARLKCSLSVAHQADLMMRSLVGMLIKEAKAKESFSSAKLPEFSRKVNAGRQSILVNIKDGSLKFPTHLAVEVCDENREDMLHFLRLELEKYLEDQ